MRPRVKAGHRYRMGQGEIQVDSVLPMSFADITPELALESGFKGVVDLLKIAKHGRGENVYLVRFHYMPPDGRHSPGKATPKRMAESGRDPRLGSTSRR